MVRIVQPTHNALYSFNTNYTTTCMFSSSRVKFLHFCASNDFISKKKNILNVKWTVMLY